MKDISKPIQYRKCLNIWTLIQNVMNTLFCFKCGSPVHEYKKALPWHVFIVRNITLLSIGAESILSNKEALYNPLDVE